MKKIMLVLAGCLSLGLASCSKMPSECQKTWENIEKVAKSSGIPDEALKNQKKAFEEQITNMPKDQANSNCKAQNSVMEKLNN
ncbi:hypothetical protein [Acinetobacter gerneri]|uniref:Lipoprotein n=1 Tax=Acinetobacter gerneri DSM 14967 = CIP 107464 = MTCC 9824 TaxID=1120926 RepID=N8Y7Q9_9GAMM|nr:hypothetical protein [Acinetobacter gerneri]ENV32802.1 hypothetical protein F960_02977 [Acinetobacter gerneri DSM 14967 = CIP 107464 = MTCC 9824]EPR81699.1 hypothetical protein L289_3561 [Acinetobacter gerneri DSM 14967 = CIP 107464 = MTCC 9824]MCH4242797.1 hypothetical protein [Acinetobacter gerneri]MDV2441883.1 hypothetical protein [Acinetobacter gerneri]